MKKILLFIFVVILGVMTASAQEVDSLQPNDLSARVDSLCMQLKQLQHDYDYLYCQNLIETSNAEMDKFVADIEIASLRIMYFSEHVPWDVDSYIHYKENIDNYNERLNQIKQIVEKKLNIVNIKILITNFTDSEKEFLHAECGSVERKCNVIDGAIEIYKKAVEIYKLSR